MDPFETRALVRLADQRFQSFSEAAEAVLGALEEVVPGTLMLGQFDPDERICRVIEVRGDAVNGLRRGSALPLADPATSNGSGAAAPDEGRLDGEYLRSLSVKTWLATPLEMSDGTIAGNLCALATDTEAFCTDHAALLGVAARLLGYEWESVNRRAELRKLRERARDGSTTDPDTGLANRESFVDSLDREWRLAERGTVQSVLVTCQVDIEPSEGAVSKATTNLALKDAAEVLNATVRTTDHAGRVGDARLAAVLIGCEEVGAAAFVQRFEAAFRRVTHARPHPVRVAFAVLPLAGTPSPGEALESAVPTLPLEEETAG
jgi:GGDEF domain-containing protein